MEGMKASHRGFKKSLYGKLSRKIVEKPVSFYQYGLNTDEKKACKIIFHEIFEVNLIKHRLQIAS